MTTTTHSKTFWSYVRQTSLVHLTTMGTGRLRCLWFAYERMIGRAVHSTSVMRALLGDVDSARVPLAKKAS